MAEKKYATLVEELAIKKLKETERLLLECIQERRRLEREVRRLESELPPSPSFDSYGWLGDHDS